MASPIATLFARLGFDVDEKGLRRFEGQLKTLKNDINSMGVVQHRVGKEAVQSTNKQTKAVNQQAKATGNLSQNIKDVVAGYGRVPKTLQDAQKDMGRLQKLQARGNLSPVDTKAIVDAQARVQNRISYLEQKRAKEAADRFNKTQKERGKLYDKELKDRERAQKSFTDNFNKTQQHRNKLINEEARNRVKAQKNFADTFNKTQKERWKQIESNNKKQEASERKRLGFLERIEKSYDKHGKQLRDLRRDYSFVNEQYRQKNISIQQRNKLLQQQFERYREIQAVQRRSALDRGAGGMFAGGRDPRQVGNHK